MTLSTDTGVHVLLELVKVSWINYSCKVLVLLKIDQARLWPERRLFQQ